MGTLAFAICGNAVCTGLPVVTWVPACGSHDAFFDKAVIERTMTSEACELEFKYSRQAESERISWPTRNALNSTCAGVVGI